MTKGNQLFSFVLQGDFILPASREALKEDDKWNSSLLEKVPDLFADIFMEISSCVRTTSGDVRSNISSKKQMLVGNTVPALIQNGQEKEQENGVENEQQNKQQSEQQNKVGNGEENKDGKKCYV